MEEYSHEHDHTVHDSLDEVEPSLIPKRLGRLLAWANFAVGFVQIGSSKLNDLGNTADGAHNLGDGYVYGLQTDHLHNRARSESSIQRRRKLSYRIITLSSLGIVGKSIYDAAVGAEHDPSKWSEYSSIGSLALASAVAGYVAPKVWDRMKRGVGLTENETDFVKHNATDLASAAGAVSSVYLQKSGLHIPADIVATLTAGLSAWAFRPTKKNLNHVHQH